LGALDVLGLEVLGGFDAFAELLDLDDLDDGALVVAGAGVADGVPTLGVEGAAGFAVVSATAGFAVVSAGGGGGD
jgi:hypothetical protein